MTRRWRTRRECPGCQPPAGRAGLPCAGGAGSCSAVRLVTPLPSPMPVPSHPNTPTLTHTAPPHPTSPQLHSGPVAALRRHAGTAARPLVCADHCTLHGAAGGGDGCCGGQQAGLEQGQQATRGAQHCTAMPALETHAAQVAPVQPTRPTPAGALAGGPDAAGPRGSARGVCADPRERGARHDRLAQVRCAGDAQPSRAAAPAGCAASPVATRTWGLDCPPSATAPQLPHLQPVHGAVGRPGHQCTGGLPHLPAQAHAPGDQPPCPRLHRAASAGHAVAAGGRGCRGAGRSRAARLRGLAWRAGGPAPRDALSLHLWPPAPNPCTQLDYRRMARGGSLGARHVTPAETALVTAVLGTGAAQTYLLPALMAAYAHADHVVGLDVDRDQVGWGRVGYSRGAPAATAALCSSPPGPGLDPPTTTPANTPTITTVCHLPSPHSTTSSTCAAAWTRC